MHPGRIKIYPNFWEIYWWNNMKREIAQFVKKKSLIYQQIKVEHQRLSGLLQPLSILERKWELISMDLYLGYQGHLGIMMLFGWSWIGLSISFWFKWTINWEADINLLMRFWGCMGCQFQLYLIDIRDSLWGSG